MLIEIYEQKHDWQQLFDTLNKKVELLESEARIDVLTRMANLAVQRLDMVDDGIDLWRIVRQERPDEGESALVQLLERHERYDDLAEVYLERLADLTGDERVAQLKQLIPILTDKLGDEERAEEALNDILETDPGWTHMLRRNCVTDISLSLIGTVLRLSMDRGRNGMLC